MHIACGKSCHMTIILKNVVRVEIGMHVQLPEKQTYLLLWPNLLIVSRLAIFLEPISKFVCGCYGIYFTIHTCF